MEFKMHTLKLNINDTIYDKIMWFLYRFDKSEIEIIHEDSVFNSNKDYLNNELNRINSNEVIFITADELNNSIDKVISKYEN
jgi:hypothetical protein